MRSVTLIALLALSTFAACAPKPAPVEAAAADLSVEPTSTGKYK